MGSYKSTILYSIVLNVGTNLVGKLVELFLVQCFVSTGISIGSFFEGFNFVFGWGFHISLLNLLLNSSLELFRGDLSIVVGVDSFENLVRFFIGDTFFTFGGDLDGSGGGNEGDEGEFHLFVCLFYF
tara:strand:+ start:243 stop:623 length:381 start_codon:yes stop_codon:yes gene_type:complete